MKTIYLLTGESSCTGIQIDCDQFDGCLSDIQTPGALTIKPDPKKDPAFLYLASIENE